MIRIRVQAVIFNEDGEILLVKHTKGDREYYVLPGGGVEYQEPLLDALVRELREELNIGEIFSARFLKMREFIDFESDRHVIDVYYYVVANLRDVRVAEEDGILSGFNFFSLDELERVVVYPSHSFIKELVKECLGEIIRR